ncbi:MAG: methyltransferase domain-containing protein [Rhodobacteraceae bacterium]|uniref:SAM-dependent methyltransferase n=1 Tax=Albidovulum sp. TaxID=1872424 RepID=UPI001D46425F|nr:methyltransferase domain-containing protein [Paracoccaceae bacterium]HPE26928.1 methyltransferase domain-containing protein [Albidovulum sp.]MCB2132207.1 methyltransferase domain-containing protein [Paracoccaceae bacterium]MCB2142882.1 methyltransferase domain-containing protein [Paracoccaceae bacterium]MCB2150636.1 methyltransferase domain-containing protein [Paracoccaceae bacterium]
MWNDRYAGDEYLFGTAPADFLLRAAPWLTPGESALAIADGEGRNSVWLAGQGLAVTAFDPAPNAVAKARRLAEAKGTAVEFHLTDLDGWDWTRQFDIVAAIFIQFVAPAERPRLFDRIKAALRPGGLLLLHGYAPRQVDYGTGGPSRRENMYTLDLLHDAFAGWQVLRAEDFDADVDEGRGHSGRSALIDFVARKPL